METYKKPVVASTADKNTVFVIVRFSADMNFDNKNSRPLTPRKKCTK